MALSRRGFLKGLSLAAVSATPAFAQRSFWGQPLPDEPVDFIFGYGSLINTPSREGTGRPGIPTLPARLSPDFGHVRSWCARSRSGFTALGLRPRAAGEEGGSINGVVFPVDAGLLPRFDRREGNYNRVPVSAEHIETVSWQRLPERGTIWVYVPKSLSDPSATPLLPDAEHPIVQSYVDLVLQGALEYGGTFASELIATTADWGRYWLNDREYARRPWMAIKEAGRIDELLAITPPAAASFPNRLYSEAYSARHMRPVLEGAPR
ncbi:gamma-glutamylcyclotransferase family protein [Aquabacter sp. CN5-332]|uniref:gamma-glutamylcyclotransferase family protein n=1 Tax=Aquabacter sp. CN5-332 TaxID=3156608 RepID=UPI0032B484AD